MPRKHVRVRGRVQGVAFRYTTQQTAERLGVRGWVRNLRGGQTVELIVEADAESLEAFLDWCREGPSYARVDTLEVEETTDTEPFGGFEIRSSV